MNDIIYMHHSLLSMRRKKIDGSIAAYMLKNAFIQVMDLWFSDHFHMSFICILSMCILFPCK